MPFRIRIVITAPKEVIHFTRELVEYLIENPGAVFVMAFMILLVDAALLIANGFDVAANDAATLGFYSLVAGVTLQVFAYVRRPAQEDQDTVGMS